ncbi:unnamed protein product [Linum tenue]|nr:unnamed protein product [Linum tenue]
MQMRLTM